MREIKLKPLVTDNPEGSYQNLHNMTGIDANREVYLRDFNGEGDLNLVDFCKKQCDKKCEVTIEAPVEEFGEYMDCSCIVAYFYHMAVGHAELRHRLGEYESSEVKETCEWEEDDSGTWSCSKCGASWEFNNGGPEDNDMHYCPKCGRGIIRVSGYEEDE